MRGGGGGGGGGGTIPTPMEWQNALFCFSSDCWYLNLKYCMHAILVQNTHGLTLQKVDCDFNNA